MTAVSESDSTMEDLPDDNEEPEKAESISKESRESEKVDSDYATNYLAKVKVKKLYELLKVDKLSWEMCFVNFNYV